MQAPNGKTERKDKGVAIVVTPTDNEAVRLARTPDGGMTIRLRGEITIGITPPLTRATESVLSDTKDTNYSLVPDSPPQPTREAVNSSEQPSGNGSSIVEDEDMPENENRKFELVGNPVFDPYYNVRRSGKKIADFALATHNKKGETHYYRIRAFDKRAERVRDTLRKGQTGVEAVVYGPKYWRQKKHLKDGTWTQEVVEGYYAGMVRVPERYKERYKDGPTPQEKTD